MKYSTYYNEGFRDKLEQLRKQKKKDDKARHAVEKEENEKKFKKASKEIDDITTNLLRSNAQKLRLAYQESYGIFSDICLV